MKQTLKLKKKELAGVHAGIIGTISPDLTGNVSGLRGDVSGIIGDLDACELTPKERKQGVEIRGLVK